MKNDSTQSELEFSWETLPWASLPLSFQVDCCQFISREKPVVRSQILDFKFLDYLISVSKEMNWDLLYDDKGFFVISRCKTLSQNVLSLDHNPAPHAETLGNLLGYPKCCSKFIAQHGESRIDELDIQFNTSPKFEDFRLIDISSYRAGISLLSHVPCSVECALSLALAKRIKSFILNYNKVKGFSLWAQKIKSHYNFDLSIFIF